MNANDVRHLLRIEVAGLGSQARFARSIGVSRALIYSVLNGSREPRGKLLDAIDVEAVTTYRKKKPPSQA